MALVPETVDQDAWIQFKGSGGNPSFGTVTAIMSKVTFAESCCLLSQGL